jgi:hypothetical protein
MLGIVVFVFMLVIILIISRSFASGKILMTVPASIPDSSDTFTLILYGGTHSNDMETIAILDRENDRYTFTPYAPQFKYTIKKGVPAKEAFGEAQQFVSWHRSFHQSQVSRIVDDHGNTLGYELRPLYLLITFGVDDVLEVDYRMKADRVVVTIRLNPSLEPMRL